MKSLLRKLLRFLRGPLPPPDHRVLTRWIPV